MKPKVLLCLWSISSPLKVPIIIDSFGNLKVRGKPTLFTWTYCFILNYAWTILYSSQGSPFYLWSTVCSFCPLNLVIEYSFYETCIKYKVLNSKCGFPVILMAAERPHNITCWWWHYCWKNGRFYLLLLLITLNDVLFYFKTRNRTNSKMLLNEMLSLC